MSTEPATGRAPRVQPWMEAACLLLLALAAYANSFHGAFVLDSEPLVLGDPRVHAVTWENLRAIFNQSYWYPLHDYTLYRPLVKLAWAVEYSVLGFGRHSFGYHLCNFLWHAVNIVLLWQLALATGLRRIPAFFLAAIFAVHPVATEAVANIAARPDLMATAFVLMVMLVDARSREVSRPAWLFVFAAAAAGVGCKEAAVVVLPLLLAYHFAFRELSWPSWRARVPMFLAAGGGIAMAWGVRYAVLSRLPAAIFPYVDNPLQGLSFWEGRLTACTIIVRYLKLLAWPASLSCDYSYNQIPPASVAAGTGALAAVLLLLAAAVLAFRYSRHVFFFALLFFLSLFPAANIAVQFGSIMAERFLYLPSAGFAACLVLGVAATCRRLRGEAVQTRVAAIVLSVLIVALSVRTSERNRDWSSNLTLWSSAVKTSPASFKTHWILGNSLLAENDPLRLPEAIQEEQSAIAILRPLPPERSLNVPYAVLGRLWLKYGDELAKRDVDGAQEAYRSAVRAFRGGIPSDQAYNRMQLRANLSRGPVDAMPNEGNPPLYTGLAEALSRLGRFAEAVEAESYIVSLTPGDAGVYGTLAELEEKSGAPGAALTSAAQAVLIDRSSAAFGRLDQLFQHHAAGTCPAVNYGTPTSLNLACPAVKAIACTAEKGLLENFRNAHHPELIPQYEAIRITGTACATQ